MIYSESIPVLRFSTVNPFILAPSLLSPSPHLPDLRTLRRAMTVEIHTKGMIRMLTTSCSGSRMSSCLHLVSLTAWTGQMLIGTLIAYSYSSYVYVYRVVGILVSSPSTCNNTWLGLHCDQEGTKIVCWRFWEGTVYLYSYLKPGSMAREPLCWCALSRNYIEGLNFDLLSSTVEKSLALSVVTGDGKLLPWAC